MECNVSHQAPYNHFENKEKFLEAMQEYITDKFADELEKTILICANKKFLWKNLEKHISIFFTITRIVFIFFLVRQI